MASGRAPGSSERSASRKRGRPAATGLTGREWQVARLAAEGLSRQEIGARLYLSQWTVKGHLAKIHAKLEMTDPRDRAELGRRLARLEANDPS